MINMIIMNAAHMAGLDLGLLRALDALLRERHVTRAARRLGLTQSAMSHSLRRLREVFDDPLFLRAPRGVSPTPRAAQLAEPLERVLAELERLTQRPEAFDPARLERRFGLGTTDYLDVVLLPVLLARLQAAAPRVDLDVRAVPVDLDGALEEGLDLGFGVQPRHGARVMQQRLFEDRLLCLARRGHPAAARRLTMARFAALSHVQIAPRGHPGGAVDEALGREGLERRVAVRVGSFLAAPLLVAQSDLVLTAPERLARIWVRMLPLEILEPPMTLPRFAVYQVWHERRHRDPAHAWLRAAVAAAGQAV
jgi:DNA-binding transcriptional LysR family regulator